GGGQVGPHPPPPHTPTGASDDVQLPLPLLPPPLLLPLLRSALRPAAVRRPPTIRHAAQPAQQEPGRRRHQARDRHVPPLKSVPREQRPRSTGRVRRQKIGRAHV